MKKLLIYFLAIGVVLVNACQKEKSFEIGNSPSEGTLQSDVNGDCLPKSVNGTYTVGSALLSNTNTITVQVNVTKVGSYTIYTDTVNGYSFKATGTFAATGAQNITLKGSGTPFAAGSNSFIVTYGTSVCDIQVVVGGGTPATFTLQGAPSACTPSTVNGTYAVGVALGSTHTVVIGVNVTVAGSYTISTNSVGGMTFSASGTFASTGTQNVTLQGAGTPTTAGSNTFTVTAGSSSCTFAVTVGSASAGTLGGGPGACTPSTVNGTYTVGTALTGTNTVTVQVNVTTAGAYSITTNTVTGFSFSKSGNFASTGVQNVTLDGTGTPTTAGAQTFTVTYGSSSCTFSVTVAGGGGNAVGTLGGGPGACTPSTVNGIYVVGTATGASNTVTIQANVTTAGAYTISTNTVTGFSFSLAGNFGSTGTQSISLQATGTPTTAGPQTFTVTWGSSTCTFTVNVLPNDYFPRTANSNWSYEFDDDQNDSLYRKAIVQTLTAISNTYNIFMGDDGSGLDSSGYYRKASSSYYEYLDFGNFIGYDGPSWGEYIMVQDNQAANFNWKTPTAGFPGTYNGGTPVNIRFSMTIKQKDVPITIVTSKGTVTYQNVIVVEEKFEGEASPGVWVDATNFVGGYGMSNYARGVGLIKFELYDPSNTLLTKQELRRFQIF